MRRFFVLVAMGLLLALPAHSEEGAESAAPEQIDAEGSADQPRDAAARRKGGKSPEERTAAFRARLLKDIELSDEQERRIDAIERTQAESLKKQQDKITGLRDQIYVAREAAATESIRKYSAELREARKDSPSRSAWISEVREVLDPDQQQQFDANRDKMQSESKRRRSSQQQGKKQKKEAAE